MIRKLPQYSVQTDYPPKPVIHASHARYAMLFQRADAAGMLTWSLVSEKPQQYRTLADVSQLTLFAVSKSMDGDGLTLWSRIQDDTFPDPPFTSLPETGLLNSVVASKGKLQAFHFNVSNKFHNVSVPRWLSLLLPGKKLRFYNMT
ncbi:hypothetical protein BWQ96_01281 [Gracilariopsis chorda]|uniref:Uncharacterized protein n=1 Tax=Gracilariopsis chorda TaxID=448386 RepID=A0A2V3J3J5_9FLOR|nr:hypothetical protein BWQ96_01281 [Gracilariopsis chorda]|eukprot:PXF48939.1 hypothetical protein BWQ96_01281 [Gracilariopsis chorda]